MAIRYEQDGIVQRLTQAGTVRREQNAIAHALIITDGVGVTDSSTVVKGDIVSQTDNVGLTDSSTIGRGIALTFADNLGATDSTNIPPGPAFSVIDSVGIIDSVLIQLNQATPRKTQDGTVRITQNGTVRVIQGAFAHELVVTDNIGITEVTSTGRAHAVLATDNIGITDGSLTVAVGIRVIPIDPIGVLDPSEVNRIVGAEPPYIPTTTVGITPPASVRAAFESEVVRVVRWVDIYEADNETVWRANVPVMDGSVSVDMSRDDRRNLDITMYDDGTLPYGPNEGFWYDKILKPYRGIEMTNGDIWVTQLGEFLPDTVDRPRFPNTMHATCRDFVKKLLNDKFPDTTSFAVGQNVGTVVQAIAANGGITKFAFSATTSTLPTAAVFERGSERWPAMVELATSIGYELFFSKTGHLVFRPFVDPLTAPVAYTFQTGTGGNLVDFTQSTNDTFLFNDVIVYGDSANNALVHGRATNTQPTSPTRVDRIGRRIKPMPLQFVPNNTKANEIAASFLAVSALEQFDMNLTSIVVPWLEAGDAAEVLNPEADAGDPTRYLLSSFTIPLGLGTMTGLTKRVTIVG